MEAAEHGSAPAGQLDERTKRWVLVACILGTTVVTLDSTVVNVALPAIAEDLGGGLAGQQWTANAYLVTLGSLLLIGGSLGDIFGERRVFSFGVLAFGATSVLAAVSPTIEVLVLARALQGVAGALLTPAALAVIVATFPPDERGKAVGAWTAWGGIGTVVGPIVGGQLVDSASWRWIFGLNVPIVVITMLLILRVVPEGRERDPDAQVDVVGALLCAFGLAGMTFGLIEQPLHGWTDPMVALPLVGGALLFAGFLVWEARTSHPMLPLVLFRRRNFAFGNIETFAMYGGLGLLFFFLVLFLQQVAGFSALEAGTTSIPVTVMMFLLSMRFGALADKHGPRFFMGVGPLVAAAGMALLVWRVDADMSYLADLLPGLVVFGLGLSLTVAPLTSTVLADADESNAGIASGVNNAIARVAGLVAIAAVGAVVAASFSSKLEDNVGPAALQRPEVRKAVDEAERQPLSTVAVSGVPEEVEASVREASTDASVSAFRVGLGIATALVALGGVLGLVGITNPRRRVDAADCAGGQLVGQPQEGARQSPCDWGDQAKPLPVVALPASATASGDAPNG
jgi:EmrB/QacA subfamily drug resistance transporter